MFIGELRKFKGKLMYPEIHQRILGSPLPQYFTGDDPIWVFYALNGPDESEEVNLKAMADLYDQVWRYNGERDPSNAKRTFHFTVEEIELTKETMEHFYLLTIPK